MRKDVASRFRDIASGRTRGVVACFARMLLSVAEVPYRWVVMARNRRFDQGRNVTQVEVPVISVGNLTLGGTGKTPFIEWLAHWFRQREVRVSIVSRGYGAKKAEQRNDEAKQLDQLLPDVPHLQNPDRIAAANVAIEELATQLILLDDGFQHRRLARDLDIVLIDATEPFGFDHVFPRGTLREPLDGLRRADLVVITRSDLVEPAQLQAIQHRLAQIVPDTPVLTAVHQPAHLRTSSGRTVALDFLTDKRIGVFSAIGNPAAFQKSIAQTGAVVAAALEFPDHHIFDETDIAEIQRWVQQSGPFDVLVCTHKDLVKLNVDRLAGCPLFAFSIQMAFPGGTDALDVKLQHVLDQIPADAW
ncbi:MAG: tetraacyldisaccharide 4'-kinase [Pirellulaceae bacterium]